jgi:hypothetical protein
MTRKIPIKDNGIILNWSLWKLFVKTLSGSGLCTTMEGCVISRTEARGSATLQTVVHVHNGERVAEVSLEL